MRKHYTEGQRTALVELVTTGQATPRAAAAQLGVTASCAESRPVGNAMRIQALECSSRAQVDHQQRYHGAAMGTEAVRFLILWMAGWIHSRQLEVIDFLREGNRVLREQLGGRRLRFTDDHFSVQPGGSSGRAAPRWCHHRSTPPSATSQPGKSRSTM